MKKTSSQFRGLLKNQKGQGIMEYVIVTSLIGILCIGVVKSFGSTVKDKVEKMENNINRNINFQKIR